MNLMLGHIRSCRVKHGEKINKHSCRSYFTVLADLLDTGFKKISFSGVNFMS